MEEVIFVRDCDFGEVEKTIRAAMVDVQKGKYAEELKTAGITPPANLLDGLKISKSGQGMSPTEWTEIVTVFGPTAAVMAKDIWKIVVLPKLKRVFREDSVSEKHPHKRK